ncbi:MAG TPA: hypothetical protein PK323_13135 [Bacteroidia bacterium]|nr:hypothetical protein [Bacteroidia bacterium]
MKTLKLNSIFLATLIALAFTSCKKEDVTETVDNEVSTAKDSEESESVSDEVGNITDGAAKGTSIVGRNSSAEEQLDVLSNCAVITHDTISNPHLLTIDFGTTNCLCNDGKYRRGQILVSYTGSYFAQGSVKTTTFNNYYRNDNKVEGTRTVTNLGLNADGNMTWSVSAVNMKVTRTTGAFHTWNSERTRTMIAGQNTSMWSDDQYSISGSGNGVNANGVSYTANITTPLHRALSCHWIDSGVIAFTRSNGSTRTINFGTGTCDDQAVVTVTRANGNTSTQNITLH